MASIVLPFVTTYDDKGAKKAQASLASLMKTNVAAGLSFAAVTQQLGKAVKAASEDASAQEQLKLAIQNNTNATDAQMMAVEKSLGQMEMSAAVADDVLRPALATLVRSTKDVASAQNLLALALDISAGTGKDLESVSLALAKANAGNFGALTRLGVPLSKNTIASKDFAAATRELGAAFDGASEKAANSAAGGMAKFKIAVDNLYEAVGYQLLPVLGDYVTVATELITTVTDADKSQSNWFTKAVKWAGQQSQLVQAVGSLNWIVHNLAETTKDSGKEFEASAAKFRIFDQALGDGKEQAQKTTDEIKKLKEEQKRAREEAKRHADQLRGRMSDAIKTVTAKVEEAQRAWNDYRDSLRDSIESTVSLSSAVQTQQDAEANLTKALEERRDAYADLNRLDPVTQADEYAHAMERVAEAEKAVGTAQRARADADYSKIFAKQIAAAKEFAGNLQALVANGLGKSGLQQLLNLGPEAGNQVAKDLLTGAAGMSIGGLNQQLAELSGAGTALGVAGAGAFFGADLAAAQGAAQQVNQFNITVTAGLVSNPAQVGRDIIEAIKKAEKVSGKVFVSVK